MKQCSTAVLLPFCSPGTLQKIYHTAVHPTWAYRASRSQRQHSKKQAHHAPRKHARQLSATDKPLVTTTMSARSAKIGAPVVEGGRDKAIAIMPAAQEQAREASAEKIQEARAAIGGSIKEWSATVSHGAVDVKSEFAPHASHGSRLTQVRWLHADIAIDSVKTLYTTVGPQTSLYVIILLGLAFCRHIKLALIGAYLPLIYKATVDEYAQWPMFYNALFAGLLYYSHPIYCSAIIATLIWHPSKSAFREIAHMSACIAWDILTLAYTTTMSICRHPALLIIDILYRHIWQAVIIPELVSLICLAIKVGTICIPRLRKHAMSLHRNLVAPYFIPVFEVGMVVSLICWDLFFAILKTCLKHLYKVVRPPSTLAANGLRWARTVDVPDTKTVVSAVADLLWQLLHLLFRVSSRSCHRLPLSRFLKFTCKIISALSRAAAWMLFAITTPATRTGWYSRWDKMIEHIYAEFPILAHVSGTFAHQTTSMQYRPKPSSTEDLLAALQDLRHPLHYVSNSRTDDVASSNMSRQQSAQSGTSSATAVNTPEGSSDEKEGDERPARGMKKLYRGLGIGRAKSPAPTASVASPTSTPSLAVGISSCSSSEVLTPIDTRGSFLEEQAPTVEKSKKRLSFFSRSIPVISPCGPMDHPGLSQPCSPDRRKVKHQWVGTNRTAVANVMSTDGTRLASGAVEGPRSRSPSPVSSASISSGVTSPAQSRRPSVDLAGAGNDFEQPEAGPSTLVLVPLPGSKAKDTTRPKVSRFLSFRSRANSTASSIKQGDADQHVDVKGKGRAADPDAPHAAESHGSSSTTLRRPSKIGRGSSFRTLFIPSYEPSAGRLSTDTATSARSSTDVCAAGDDVPDKTHSTVRPTGRLKRFLSHKRQASDDWVVSHGSQVPLSSAASAEEPKGLNTLRMRRAISTPAVPQMASPVAEAQFSKATNQNARRSFFAKRRPTVSLTQVPTDTLPHRIPARHSPSLAGASSATPNSPKQRKRFHSLPSSPQTVSPTESSTSQRPKGPQDRHTSMRQFRERGGPGYGRLMTIPSVSQLGETQPRIVGTAPQSRSNHKQIDVSDLPMR